jgi:hypothetical protein
MPIAAQRAGMVLYWLGIAVAVFCLGISVYAVYLGGEGIAEMMAIFAVVYWASGWGLRRALTSN